MPKVDIFLNPGDDVPENLHSALNEYFNEQDFEKLKKFGGRIQLSVTAPFTDRKAQDSQLIINEVFIDSLIGEPKQANDKLKNLTKDQLVKVAELLKFPYTAKATTKEIKKALTDYLNSGEKWKSISG